MRSLQGPNIEWQEPGGPRDPKPLVGGLYFIRARQLGDQASTLLGDGRQALQPSAEPTTASLLLDAPTRLQNERGGGRVYRV